MQIVMDKLFLKINVRQSFHSLAFFFTCFQMLLSCYAENMLNK